MLKRKKLTHKSTKGLAWTLISLGIVGLSVSIFIYSRQPKSSIAIHMVKSVEIAKAPSSIKLTPATVSTYSVPPTSPKYITIPALGINETPVLELSILKSGAIATPDNIFETGWYTGSSRPGQAGAMFVYGHVSSWTAKGVFYNLKQLTPGQEVTITRGDNKTFTYQVISKKVYAYNEVNMQQVLSPIDPNVPGLNLMTCTGQVIKGTSEFNERLVVFTSLLSSQG